MYSQFIVVVYGNGGGGDITGVGVGCDGDGDGGDRNGDGGGEFRFRFLSSLNVRRDGRHKRRRKFKGERANTKRRKILMDL